MVPAAPLPEIFIWTGATSDAWALPGNWTNNIGPGAPRATQLPGPKDDVFIDPVAPPPGKETPNYPVVAKDKLASPSIACRSAPARRLRIREGKKRGQARLLSVHFLPIRRLLRQEQHGDNKRACPLFFSVLRGLARWLGLSVNQPGKKRGQARLLSVHFLPIRRLLRQEQHGDNKRACPLFFSAIEGQTGEQAAAGMGMTTAGVYLARSRVISCLKAQLQEVLCD